MNNHTLCPCLSGLPYADCCEAVLNDHRLALTAEILMRSRYTAFVIKHIQHLLTSWHPSSRPRNLNFDKHRVTWLGLEIHQATNGQIVDTSGSVEFTSTYLENGQLCKLRENSRFTKEDDLWYYQGGECTVDKRKVARSAPCPCGSGKKFKRCCLII